MLIRKELPEDSNTEPEVITKLRAASELTLSLVAIQSNTLVGHVAFSPVVIGESSNGWYGLGPVSVKPELQRTGIGSALINEGLRSLKDAGADGCALIGNPDYYCRFGFVSDGSIQYQDLPDRLVQWISFNQTRPKGVLTFSAAFDS